MHKIINFIILAAVIGAFSSCYYDNKTELYPQLKACDTTYVGFAAFVKPAIAQGCNSCHSGNNPIGIVKLNDYNEISASAKTGKLYGSLHQDQGFKAMPQGGIKWSDCDLLKLKMWIDRGAKND